MIEQSVSLASSGVVKAPGYERLLRFGYTKNRGVYRLAVTATGEWEGLTIRAFWHVSGGSDPASSLVVDGYVDVPASVTVQPGDGCITFEGSDGTKTVTSADLRYRVSANSGTEDGTEPEPGTPAWQQLVDAVHTDATAAEQAKTDAQTAANQAGASAGEAAASAKNAGQSAADALVWADAAKKSALAAGSNSQNAAQYAGAAKRFAEQAADSSSAAESSASAAAGSQQAAESSAKKSDASANTAQESATLATGSASKAAQAQKNAETAADRAETAQQKTEEVRTDALDKISAAKADALKAVDAKQADATAAVERTQKKALDAVTAAQGTAVKAVSDAQSTATQAVQTTQTDAVSAVEKAGSKVLESIPEDYQTTVKKVEELKTEKAEIDDSTVGPDAWSSKHIVDVLCPPLEETGNPVVCYPVENYPLGVVVSWEPVQEGSGEPSPDNIRPIKGRDSVTVKRQEDSLALNLYLPNTIYGGSLDAVTGEGKETWKLVTLDGTTNKFSGGATYWNLPINSATGVGDWYLNNIYSSHFCNMFGGNARRSFIYTTTAIMTKYFQNADALNAYLAAQYAAGTPVQIAYKLATPEPFTATGAQPITALPGVNTVLTDAYSVTVTGRADPIKRITDLETSIASMTNT